MKGYQELSREELLSLHEELLKEYDAWKEKGLSLNMARGKPSSAQLDLTNDFMTVLGHDDYYSEDGTDLRNYGILDGICEAKKLMGDVMDAKPSQTIVFSNSSLKIMFDTVSRAYTFGILGSTPWCKLDKVKFLCPVPGYDRHFGITAQFGIEMIPIPMDENGPDMDLVEEYVNNDEAVKGIWCVPKYSNPTGIVYSEETVKRFAALKPAAKDFRIYWDNAYALHHLYPDIDVDIPNILEECEKAGNPDMVYQFASTSKITFPGAGIAAMSASEANIEEVKYRLSWQTIGYDKINQMRHVRFLKDAQGIAEHMRAHAAVIRPKFELVCRKLSEGLEGAGIGAWTNPRGGYFVSFDAPEGTAKRIVALAKEAGVTMTGAGATWPYKKDPDDSNIRIAPTLPPLEELDTAMDVFVCCVKLAAIEKMLA